MFEPGDEVFFNPKQRDYSGLVERYGSGPFVVKEAINVAGALSGGHPQLIVCKEMPLPLLGNCFTTEPPPE